MERLSDFFHSTNAAYIRWVIRNRYLVVLLSVSCCVLLAMQAQNLRVEASYKYFYEEENADLIAFNYIEDTYTKIDSTVMIIEPKNESIGSPRILKIVKEMTDTLWEMPSTIRVDSITNYQHTEAEGDDLIVADLVEDPDSLTDADGQRIITIAASRPELNQRLISIEKNSLAIVARSEIEVGDNDALAATFLFAQGLREKLEAEHPDINFAVSGLIARGYFFSTIPLEDMQLLIPIMFALLITVMWLLTRSITAPIVAMILVSLSCAAAMGLGAILGIPISTVSSAAPVIILTVAVADAIHVLISYLVLRNQGEDQHNAVLKSMMLNAQPILLTTATTAIGFLSLNLSVSPPYKDLGNFAAFGTCLAWALSMSFLPAMLAIVPIRKKPWIDTQIAYIGKASGIALRQRKPFFVTTLITFIVTLLLIPRLEFNDDYVTYFEKSHTSTIDMLFYLDRLAGLYDVNFTLAAEGPNGVYDPEYLRHIETFTTWLEQQPEVTHVNSILPVFKKLNQSMNGDDPEAYRIADSKALNAQYLLLYEMSLPYGLDVNDQINMDKSATRMEISLRKMTTNEYIQIAERFENWMYENLPEYMHTKGVSAGLLFSKIGVNNFDSMKFGTVAAFIGIALCIGLSLASVKLGVVSLCLVIIPFVIAFGLFALTGETLASWTPFVIPTALGLVVDATVHLLSKFHYASKQEGKTAEESITYSFKHVGMALWVSTLVLVLGFSTLAFATVTTLKMLGIGTAVILLLALIVAVMALPSMLLVGAKRK